jgi:hypothetical protein
MVSRPQWHVRKLGERSVALLDRLTDFHALLQLLEHNLHGRAQEIQLQLRIALSCDCFRGRDRQSTDDLLRNARLDPDSRKGVTK